MFPDLEMISGPDGTTDDHGGLHWSFPHMDLSWGGNKNIILRYRATIDNQVQSDDSLHCSANLDWTSTAGENPEERAYTLSSEGAVQLTPTAPDLGSQPIRQPRPGSSRRHSSLHRIL